MDKPQEKSSPYRIRLFLFVFGIMGKNNGSSNHIIKEFCHKTSNLEAGFLFPFPGSLFFRLYLKMGKTTKGKMAKWVSDIGTN